MQHSVRRPTSGRPTHWTARGSAGTGTVEAVRGAHLALLPASLVLVDAGGLRGTWLLVLIGVLLLVVVARAVLGRSRPGDGVGDEPRLIFRAQALEPGDFSAPFPSTPRPPRPEPVPVAAATPPAAEALVTQPVAYSDPMLEETVQLLPGRLVVVDGEVNGREFRFIRSSDQEVPEVTIGRAPGPSGRHLQLSAPTVSRLHARLTFRDRRWSISNASPTNPVRINGQEITVDTPVTLSDGDRIQLGEVELCFLESRP